MAKVVLKRPGIVASIGQGEAAGMAEHVSVCLEWQLGFLACPLDHPIEAVRGEWAAALRYEHERRLRCFPAKLAQRAHLIAADRMGGRLAALDAADMKGSRNEIDLAPFEAANLGGT